MKKTVIIGTIHKESKPSYKAVEALFQHNVPVVAIGRKRGNINGVEVLDDKPPIDDVHTIAMFIKDSRQIRYFDYMLTLKPQRIIFAPGTENKSFSRLAREKNIEIVENCIVSMLDNGEF